MELTKKMIFWSNKEVVETYIIFRQHNLFRSLFASAGDDVCLGSETRERTPSQEETASNRCWN